jgi:hypothetical protein
MTDYSKIEILSHEEFWARDPAPGTEFIELSNSKMTLVGSEIDVELDDPENAVMVSMKLGASPEESGYAVIHWGSWDTPENSKIRELRDEAVRLMAKEQAELEESKKS